MHKCRSLGAKSALGFTADIGQNHGMDFTQVLWQDLGYYNYDLQSACADALSFVRYQHYDDGEIDSYVCSGNTYLDRIQ